jgi:hypothetical protein
LLVHWSRLLQRVSHRQTGGLAHRAGGVHQRRSPTVLQPGLMNRWRQWFVSTSGVDRFDRDVSRAVALWEGWGSNKTRRPLSGTSVYRSSPPQCGLYVWCAVYPPRGGSARVFGFDTSRTRIEIAFLKRTAMFDRQEQSGWQRRNPLSAVSAGDALRKKRQTCGSPALFQSRSAPSATVAAGPGFAQGEREVPLCRFADEGEPVALTSGGSDKTHTGTGNPREQRATLYWQRWSVRSGFASGGRP